MTATTLILIILAVLLLAILLTVSYAIAIYNSFIRLKNNIDKAWSDIDIMLKQRFDEIPKLVAVCEGYMTHERETLEAVIKARSMMAGATNDHDMLQAQNAISGALKSLFAVSEQYPDLKANEGFRRLGSRITDLEDQIADRREMYNASVTVYNIRTEEFPDVIIARIMNFTQRELWQIDPAHREDVRVKFTNR